MPYIISVLLFLTHEHIITHQHFFFLHNLFCMDDANFTYHPSLIINYSTHFIFSHQHIFPPLWMVDAMFIFILFFLSRLTFVQFGIHSVVSSYAWFILFYCVTSLGSTHFPSCSSHTVITFFLSSCTRNMAHNAVNTRSQSLLNRKYTCTRPVRQMPFGVTTLKIEDTDAKNQLISCSLVG